eukprot:CAMPEP_0206372172 /NCGR_PEP_ID=MMETSP0294-20121207/6949_1 /ASSEMBLY_ACC=CAM_ASM_000327 /TAXON_ID=39354 /ORGANISM="Heterosigma akashiwo, Strain CCMP2393" /LENGTH=183 /DNA_ID=CAMNT_0053819497 /DNA_START=32 /DNA_END=580 /DNA_ORIENTATION=+
MANFFKPIQKLFGGQDEQKNEEGDGQVNLPENPSIAFRSISGHANAVDERNNKYTVFFIEVACDGATPSEWRVYRRYSDFKILFDSLKTRFPGLSVPPFPKKKFLGIGQLDAAFLERRQGELEAWLRDALDQLAAMPPLPEEGQGGLRDAANSAGEVPAPLAAGADPAVREFLCRDANAAPPK